MLSPRFLFGVLPVCATLAAAELPAPLLEFTFNQPDFRYQDGANPGSGALSTGTQPLKLGFRNAYGGGPPRGAGQATFTSNGTFYTPEAGGISQLPGDYAFQMDTSPGDMGDLDAVPSNSQSAAIADAVAPGLAGLSQFTVTGWFYVRGSQPLRNYARLLSNLGVGGIELRNPDDVAGRLQLRINDKSVNAPQDRFTAVGEWVFFAAAYDSAASTARFFIGGRTAPAEQIGGAVTIAAGPVAAGKRLTVGNSAEGGQRAFSGNFDNIRIYGTALGLADIDAVRAKDLAAQVNPPLPPSGLTATVQGADAVYLEWVDNSADESGFRIIRGGGAGQVQIDLPANTVNYLDGGLLPETEYTYSVVSFSAIGNLPPTASVTITTPAAVTFLDPVDGLRMEERSATSLKLAWTDRATGEAGYLVERYSEGSQAWTAAATLPANTQSATMDNLSAGQLYRYRVMAFNGDVISQPREILVQLPPRESAIGGDGADEIDERLVTRTIHVDPVNGDNANDGSALAKAKRTIMAAVALATQYNQAGEGSRILLQPGVYTEGSPTDDYWTQATIEIGSGMFGNPAMPIIIEGAGWDRDWANGDVIISGSVRYTGWTDLGGGVYQHPWTIDWDTVDPDTRAPDTLRTHHLVNVRRSGEQRWRMFYHMTGPNDPNIANLAADEGCFWVDQAANWIRVKAPSGMDLNDPALEVHVNERHRLLHFFQVTGSTSTKLYTPLVLRNLVFRHGMRGAYFQNGSNIIVEDCRFENNKTYGLVYESPFDRLTVRRCEFYSNGLGGAGTGGYADALWEEMIFDSNARHGYVSGYRGWAEEAIKLGFIRGGTFRDFRISNSWGVGLWLDTGLKNFEVYNGLIEGGVTAGVFIENNNPSNAGVLNNLFTVYLRDVWIRDHIPGNAKGVQSSENANAMVDHVFMQGTQRPFNFYFNSRGPMDEFTVKNSVIIQPADAIFFHQSSLDTWRQIFDSVIPEFDNNRYYGGNAAPFIDREGQVANLAGWVRALNGNPANPIAGAEVRSAHFPGAAGLAAVRPLLGAYPARRVLAEGGSAAKAILVSRLGADTGGPLVVDIRYTAGTGYAGPADFASLPGQVTIPAGAQAVYIPLEALADGLAEGPEILEAQVVASGAFEVLSEPARVRVDDPDAAGLPLFIVQPLGQRMFENIDEPLRVRILREGNLPAPVDFSWLALAGAQLGADYSVQPASFSFGSGDYERIVELRPLADTLVEGPETAALELVQVAGPAAVLLPPVRVEVSINDNDGWIPESVDQTVYKGVESPITREFTLANPTSGAVATTITWPEYLLEATGSEVEGGPQPDGFIDISASGTAVTWSWWFPNDDGFSSPIALPQPFNWFGEPISTVYAHSNGFITFGEPAVRNNRFATPVLLPVNTSASLPNQFAVAWANLKLDATSSVRYQQIGDILVIQWNQLLLGTDRVTFQLQFSPGNEVTAYYAAWPATANVMVAYQNRGKDRGATIIGQKPLPGVPYAIRFDARPAAVGSATRQVSIAAGAQQPVSYIVEPGVLAPGPNATLVEIDPGLGADHILRLPLTIRYEEHAAAGFFGTGVLDIRDGWLLHDTLGWLYADDFPYLYSLDLCWLYTDGASADTAFWYALQWDSGWFFLPPESYPYAYFTGNNKLPAAWGYLVPTTDSVWVYILGETWIQLPRY